MAVMVYNTCAQLQPELPLSVRRRMLSNITIDFVIGLVPFLGDIADAIYKCNTKNAVLLEQELRQRTKNRGVSPDQEGDVIDPSHPERYHGYEEEQMLAARHGGPPPRYTSTKEPRRPKEVHTLREARGGGGWFGGRKQPDLETGIDLPPPKPPRRG